jgi:hypothetical protein
VISFPRNPWTLSEFGHKPRAHRVRRSGGDAPQRIGIPTKEGPRERGYGVIVTLGADEKRPAVGCSPPAFRSCASRARACSGPVNSSLINSDGLGVFSGQHCGATSPIIVRGLARFPSIARRYHPHWGDDCRWVQAAGRHHLASVHQIGTSSRVWRHVEVGRIPWADCVEACRDCL